MPAAKINYLVVYKNSSQVYGATSLETAIKNDAPKGCSLDDQQILFLSFQPDEQAMCVFKVTPEEIATAREEFVEKKEKAKAKEVEQVES